MNLHLVRLRPNPARLVAFAAAQHALPRNGGDLGYAIHLALRRALGSAAPQPFRWFEDKGELLGYVRDANALEDARMLPAPDRAGEAARAALSLDTLDFRTMPASWRAGARYAFEARVRPVRRIGKDKRGQGPGEHDAFGLAVRGKPREAWPAPADVYLGWTAERLRRGGAVPVDVMSLLSLKRTEIVRRCHDEDGRLVRFDGPDAVVAGTFQVCDAVAFAGLLAHGVGRHVAFGFGMLLLRPAHNRGTPPC